MIDTGEISNKIADIRLKILDIVLCAESGIKDKKLLDSAFLEIDELEDYIHDNRSKREMLVNQLILTIDEFLPGDHIIRKSNSYDKLSNDR